MLRFTALLTVLLATSPVAAEPLHFNGRQDGVSFNFTSERTRDGDLLLRGTYLDKGEQFELTVHRHGHVEGYVGATPVSFDVPQQTRDRAMADLPVVPAVELAQQASAR